MKKALVTIVFLYIFIPLFSQVADSSYISLKPAEFREELAIVSNPAILRVFKTIKP